MTLFVKHVYAFDKSKSIDNIGISKNDNMMKKGLTRNWWKKG